MKNNLLKMLLRVSAPVFLAILVQTIPITTLKAYSSVEQQKSVYDIKVSLNVKSMELFEIFKEIERKTEFIFTYNSNFVENKSITFNSKNKTLGEVLELISRKASIQFKRVNENIHVIGKVQSEPKVVESYEEAGIEKTIKGTITDENGDGLPGAAVYVKGTNNGAITNAMGEYQISVPDDATTLVISFVGFKTVEAPIQGRTTIDISLEPDFESLSEVVVIGYQEVQKKDLTGSTAIISPEASSKVSANSLAESIQGLAPGITVRNGGAPGQGSVIEIRGVGSFSDTNPLYVIDGMLADANPTINTNDIESIQILKDASAAAIYGSRAANGVIIITTKKGKEGPMQVSFTGKTGVQQIPNTWDVMNSQEFAAMQRTQYENSGLTPPALVDADFDPSVDTDWQNEMIRTGSIQDYNISLSGGSKSGNYMVSGSYFDNEGVLKGRNFKRYSLRINSNSDIGDWVTFGENLLVTHTINKNPGVGNPFLDMPQFLPVIPVQGDEYINPSNPKGWGIGSVNAPTYAWNPLAVLDLSEAAFNYTKIVGNAFIRVKLTDWMSYKFNAGIETSFDYTKTLRKDGIWSFNAAVYPSSVTDNRSTYLSRLFEHTLNINKDFGNHSINAVFGISQQSNQREYSLASRTELQQFDGRYLNTINSATGDAAVEGGRPVDNYLVGYLGRIKYNYNERYLLTLTGRIDKNSRFAEEYRTGVFPSVAAGWRISEEDFFNVAAISNLKITASYGRLGVIPSAVGSWDYIGLLNSNPRAIFGPDEEAYVGAYQARISNQQLQWETRISQNFGVDAGLFNNRLNIGIEYYNSLSEDAILVIPLARYLGNLNGDPFVNTGSLRNQGFEFNASYRKREGDFQWDVSANFTTIKNKVESVGNRGEGIDYLQTGLTRSKVGRPIAEWYLLKEDGIFQSEQEVLDHVNEEGTVIQPDAQPGDIRFIDTNGDGQITDEDRDYSGKSAWPSLQAGGQFNAAYKNFTLNLQLVGVFGNYVYNSTRQILDGYQNTNFRSDIQPWTEENPNTDDPRIGVAANDVALSQNAGNSTRWLENASYVRLRNLEIGYNFSKEMFGNVGINNARIYLSGQNLLTFTQYSGLDPDVTGNGILERGVDGGNWPSSRMYSVGLQFQF